jgi:hypothetical protein
MPFFFVIRHTAPSRKTVFLPNAPKIATTHYPQKHPLLPEKYANKILHGTTFPTSSENRTVNAKTFSK